MSSGSGGESDRDDEDLFSEANISIDEDDESTNLPSGQPRADARDSRHRRHTEYYALLGLPADASPVEIRRAFLQLSRRYHTDKHSGSAAEVQEVMSERFQELTTAYTVLADPRQRIAYDLKGKKGAQHLALVPKSAQSSQDIVDIVRALDRAAKLQHMSRMLSSTSAIDLEYSTVPIFQWLGNALSVASEEKPQPGTIRRGSGDSLEEEQQNSEQTETDEEPVVKKQEDEESEEELPRLDKLLQGSSAQVHQGNMNGKTIYFLLPDQDLMAKYVNAMQRKQNAERRQESMKYHNVSQSEVDQVRRRLIPVLLAARALLPTGVSIRHSFKHAISSNSFIQFSGEGSSTTRPVIKTGYFYTDPETHNEQSVRVWLSMRKCALLLSRLVHLSALWAMRTKLSVFDGFQVLKFFDISLLRKLTPSSVLESTLHMSLFEHGTFSSSIASENYLGSVLFGANKLNFSGAWASPMDLFPSDILTAGGLTGLGDGAGHRRKTKKAAPPGTFTCIFFSSPLTGISVLEWKFLYDASRYYKLGVGFSVKLPYSLSPFAPPYFIVQSAMPMTNMVKLIYQRGDHTLSIPIAVFISESLSKSVLWLTLPMMVTRLCMLLYIPFAKAYAAQFYTRERAKHIPEMDIARQKALLEQQALESIVLSSRSVEERKSGLVILMATYGVLYREYGVDVSSAPGSPTICSFVEQPPLLTRAVSRVSQWLYRLLASKRYQERTGFTFPLHGDAESNTFSTVSEEEKELTTIPLSIDVTVPLQNLVRDSALTLPEGSKASLTGFYDTDPYTAEKKQLKIVYLFRGKRHVVVLNDEDEVLIPQREHLEALEP